MNGAAEEEVHIAARMKVSLPDTEEAVRAKYRAGMWSWMVTCKQGSSATPFKAAVLRL